MMLSYVVKSIIFIQTDSFGRKRREMLAFPSYAHVKDFRNAVLDWPAVGKHFLDVIDFDS